MMQDVRYNSLLLIFLMAKFEQTGFGIANKKCYLYEESLT